MALLSKADIFPSSFGEAIFSCDELGFSSISSIFGFEHNIYDVIHEKENANRVKKDTRHVRDYYLVDFMSFK